MAGGGAGYHLKKEIMIDVRHSGGGAAYARKKRLGCAFLGINGEGRVGLVTESTVHDD